MILLCDFVGDDDDGDDGDDGDGDDDDSEGNGNGDSNDCVDKAGGDHVDGDSVSLSSLFPRTYFPCP